MKDKIIQNEKLPANSAVIGERATRAPLKVTLNNERWKHDRPENSIAILTTLSSKWKDPQDKMERSASRFLASRNNGKTTCYPTILSGDKYELENLHVPKLFHTLYGGTVSFRTLTV